MGDKITIIRKRQVIKEILEVGENLGKPGRPFIVTITLEGYLAKPKDDEPYSGAKVEEIREVPKEEKQKVDEVETKKEVEEAEKAVEEEKVEDKVEKKPPPSVSNPVRVN